MNTNPLFLATNKNTDEYKPSNSTTGFDLNEQLVTNKPATFFMQVNSNAMVGAGIHKGDTVIVDQSIPATSGKVVIAVLNGEMLIRRLYINNKKQKLVPDTPSLAAIDVDPFADFTIWGVVTYVIHQV